MNTADIATAIELDQNDSFKTRVDLFDMPMDAQGQSCIYLNANSLGPKPKSTDQAVLNECKKWGELAVRGHFDQQDPWISYHDKVQKSLARLVGAKPEEVVAAGTLTANMHFAFVSFYQPTAARYKIIRIADFPSDCYAVTSQILQRSQTIQNFTGNNLLHLEDVLIEVSSNKTTYISLETIEEILKEQGERTSLIWLEGVHYLTGQYFDIAAITRLAHKYGCKIGLDLAHAIANVPMQLHDWNVDFAVWCSYKYLSAGPGAIAGFFIHEKYFNDPNIIRFAGWWGHNKSTRFQMPAQFDPIANAEAWQLSNPNILSLVALQQALVIFDQVNLQALREKNKRLVNYLEKLLQQQLKNEISIITPSNPEERGCQLSFQLTTKKDVHEIEKKLFEYGIVCDVRKDLLRVAPMGLYTTFQDLHKFVQQLKII